MERMGEETLSFSLLKSGKRQKVHLGRSVSTHFVADCSFNNFGWMLSGPVDFFIFSTLILFALIVFDTVVPVSCGAKLSSLTGQPITLLPLLLAGGGRLLAKFKPKVAKNEFIRLAFPMSVSSRVSSSLFSSPMFFHALGFVHPIPLRRFPVRVSSWLP